MRMECGVPLPWAMLGEPVRWPCAPGCARREMLELAMLVPGMMVPFAVRGVETLVLGAPAWSDRKGPSVREEPRMEGSGGSNLGMTP